AERIDGRNYMDRRMGIIATASPMAGISIKETVERGEYNNILLAEQRPMNIPSKVSSEPGGEEETLLDHSSAEESSSNDLGRKGCDKDRSELFSSNKVPPYVGRAEGMSKRRNSGDRGVDSTISVPSEEPPSPQYLLDIFEDPTGKYLRLGSF
ncbi:hypothetical protein FOZ62_013679, partial [Perkinsus olseni]